MKNRQVCHYCVSLPRDASCEICDIPPAPVAVAQFANEIISAAFEGGSFDGGDIQDVAPPPVAVVLPDRNKASKNLDIEQCGYVDGWNACLDATAALNAPKPTEWYDVAGDDGGFRYD